MKVISAAAALAVCAGCATGLNYSSPLGPRYAGEPSPARAPAARRAPDTIRVVTFNIQFARQVDRAIALLQSTPGIQDADVVALQEMDAPATARIAQALGMAYVYYPATLHRSTRRDFGDAILARWPIVADHKILLPHRGRFARTTRIAVAATVLLCDVPVRVYSVHLATFLEIGPRGKRDQARAVLADAAAYPHVIVAGDMNSHGIGKEFVAAGYAWPTEHNPRTAHFFNWDHVFVKGLALPDSAGAGVVRDNRDASDHRPVWAVVALR